MIGWDLKIGPRILGQVNAINLFNFVVVIVVKENWVFIEKKCLNSLCEAYGLFVNGLGFSLARASAKIF